MQTSATRTTERAFGALEDTIDHVAAQRSELAELRGYVLSRHRPFTSALQLLTVLPAFALSIAFLTAGEWLPDRWPSRHEVIDAAAVATDWMLWVIAFAAVIGLLQVFVGRGGHRSLAAAEQLHVVTSPLNRATIARLPRLGSRPMTNPIMRRVDVAVLVLDRSATEALILLILGVRFALSGDIPAVITAALLAAAAPALLERLLAAVRLLHGLRDRRRLDEDLDVRLHSRAEVDVQLKSRRPPFQARDTDALRRSAPYN